MYTELTLTTKKQSKGRNGWFRAAHVGIFTISHDDLASGDKSFIAVDISTAKAGGAAPVQLYFTPEDARAFAAVLLAHADGGDTLTAEELADFAKPVESEVA